MATCMCYRPDRDCSKCHAIGSHMVNANLKLDRIKEINKKFEDMLDDDFLIALCKIDKKVVDKVKEIVDEAKGDKNE